MLRQTFLILLAGVALAGGHNAEGQVPWRGRLALRTLSVAVRTPDPSWEIRIAKVGRVGHELWVVCRLRRAHDGPAPAVIATATDRLSIRVPDIPVRTFVTGKTWNWTNEEPYIFIEEQAAFWREEFRRRMAAAELWYEHEEAWVTTGPRSPDPERVGAQDRL